MTTEDVAEYAARIARAYPKILPMRCASLACALAKIERAQHRHAERACCGEDGGYVRAIPGRPIGMGVYTKHNVEHDPAAEERARNRVVLAATRWGHAVGDAGGSGTLPRVVLYYDPRGCVLDLRLPGEGGDHGNA